MFIAVTANGECSPPSMGERWVKLLIPPFLSLEQVIIVINRDKALGSLTLVGICEMNHCGKALVSPYWKVYLSCSFLVVYVDINIIKNWLNGYLISFHCRDPANQPSHFFFILPSTTEFQELKFLLHLLIYLFCVCICVSTWGMMPMWNPEDNLARRGESWAQLVQTQTVRCGE